MAGGEGFEPSTPNLGGWCSIRDESFRLSTSHLARARDRTPIRAELLAHTTKQQHRVNIDTKTLLKIEEVKLHLEGKGRSPNTLDGFERHMKQLAQRANLDIPTRRRTRNSKIQTTWTAKHGNQPTDQHQTTYKQKLCDVLRSTTANTTRYLGKCQNTQPEERSIQPPTDEKCLMLIAAAKGSLSIKIDISTQTGLRPIEVQGDKGLKS